MATSNRSIMGKIMQMKQLQRLYFYRTAKESGLYFGQLPILWFIGENPNCTQREIAEALGVTPASIALSTKRMQKAGLLDKQIDAQDLRCNHLSLTEKGFQYCGDCAERFSNLDAKMLDGLTDEQLEAFGDMLEIIVGNLQNLLDVPPMQSIFDIIRADNLFSKETEKTDSSTSQLEHIF